MCRNFRLSEVRHFHLASLLDELNNQSTVQLIAGHIHSCSSVVSITANMYIIVDFRHESF